MFATATGTNRVVTLDEDSGAVVAQAATGDYPDGLAYDPRRGAIWTTNESGGSETVVDAATGAVRGTVALGGEVGNVAYDPNGDRMLVAVQGRNDLAMIDPGGLTVQKRVPLPGCDHDHGLAMDTTDRLAFVACDGNATLLTVDLNSGQVLGTSPVGSDPDVLAYDQTAHTWSRSTRPRITASTPYPQGRTAVPHSWSRSPSHNANSPPGNTPPAPTSAESTGSSPPTTPASNSATSTARVSRDNLPGCIHRYSGTQDEFDHGALDPELSQHLLHALRAYEQFYNTYRSHQGISNARPLQPRRGADAFTARRSTP